MRDFLVGLAAGCATICERERRRRVGADERNWLV
jgi:hypothetical protein